MMMHRKIATLSKIAFLALLLVSASGCFTRSTLMNQETYNEIYLGTPVKEVKAKAGKPYAVHTLPGGKKEYEYIERVQLNPVLTIQTHYFLVIQEGRVIAKRTVQDKPPGYGIIYQDDPIQHY